MNRNAIIIMVLMLLGSTSISYAQLSLSGDFRTRTEYRHGFQSLIKPNEEAAFFTSQRSRINLGYKADKYLVWMSVQDIRVWGDQQHTVRNDGNTLGVHEAFVEYFLTPKLSTKIGRQELVYDDHRIFGSLDWAMQGRKHDLALLKWTDSTWSVHAGFAYNQEREHHTTNLYLVNNYKAMQFLWANKQFKRLSLSFLFLNHGLQYTQMIDEKPVNLGINYSQTIGGRYEYKYHPLTISGFAYSQTGKDQQNRTLRAYDVNTDVTYQITSPLSFTGGFEVLSGTDQNPADPSINRSFNPFYGTNHLFNGYMDYFFVNNHLNDVGLQDFYLKVKYKVYKGFVALHGHNFQSVGRILNPVDVANPSYMSRNLGNTLDFTIRQQLTSELAIQGGYSQMFATTSMEALKKGDAQRTNNWAYVWIIFKPKFM
jgi:hypothetical protein